MNASAADENPADSAEVALLLGDLLADGTSIQAHFRSAAGGLDFDWDQERRTAWMVFLWIEPAHRRRGEATRLLEAMFALCAHGGTVEPGGIVAEREAAYGLIRTLDRLRQRFGVRLGKAVLDPKRQSACAEIIDIGAGFDRAAYEHRQEVARALSPDPC